MFDALENGAGAAEIVATWFLWIALEWLYQHAAAAALIAIAVLAWCVAGDVLLRVTADLWRTP